MTVPDDRESPQVRVAAAMTPFVIGVEADLPIPGALAVMLQSHVRHLPVISFGTCVGILTEADALWELYLHDNTATTAGTCARKPAPTIHLDADLGEAAQTLRDHDSDALVVLDGDGAISGILTATDIVRSAALRSED